MAFLGLLPMKFRVWECDLGMLQCGLSKRLLSQNRVAHGLQAVRFMGGGPRTFPGGVTKWQWKRFQEKKKRERDRIWLAKEKSLYERRRRAQIMALMPVRPWERFSPAAPSLPKIDKDPKIKEMSQRFQTDKGIDLWNKADGPETCRSLVKLDQEGSAPPEPVVNFRPLTLSVSQRVTDLRNAEEREGEEQEGRFQKPAFRIRANVEPAEAPEVFQHSRFMLASYLRKHGHLGLGFSEEAIKSPEPAASSTASPTDKERTDYNSWLNALANDRERLAERKLAQSKQGSAQLQKPGRGNSSR